MAQKTKKTKIIIVDDEEIILLALEETISKEGYEIITTVSPLKALEYLRVEEFAVIISDQRMAEMTGLDFLRQAKLIQPDASRILITGVLTLKTIIDAVNKGEIFRFLAKPWIREELLVTVKNAAQRNELLEVNHKLQKDTLSLNERLSETNLDLKIKIKELAEQQNALDQANKALIGNFEHSIELCYRIGSAYHPLLGKETKAIVDLCQKMIDTGYFSKEEQHVLKTSAWLNNIGLIGISRELFLRSRQDPETLSGSEKRIISNHPIYGQTLATFVEDLASVGATIRGHHERWDGKGFPDGLARLAIPKTARFLAVNVFFAECGLSKENAIEEILNQSGKAFDPEAVRLFLKATRMIELPRKVKEVLFKELESGMTLAKGLFSPTGLLLIPEGHRLEEGTLEKIRRHNIVDPIIQRLLVYS